MTDELRIETAALEAHGPALPVEESLVGAVRALEAAKARCDVALLQAQYGPRQTADVFATLNELARHVNTAIEQYSTYAAIIECRGQA